MKRLFMVKDQFFATKKDAKAFRDVNGGHVSIGPDHRKWGTPKKTHDGSSGHKSGQSVGDGFPKKRRK